MKSQNLHFRNLNTMDRRARILLATVSPTAKHDQHFRREVSCLLPGKPVVTGFTVSQLRNCTYQVAIALLVCYKKRSTFTLHHN